MAEANLIPGATQVFADVLEGGSVKKLFDNMQKGKYDLQDIVKVLDSLESKLKKDVLSKMFSKPSVAMNDFRTALTRFWEEVNAAGGSDMMIGVLTSMADSLKAVTQWMKDNKETIDSWIKGIKIAGKVLWELVPALLAIWGLKKAFNLLGIFQSVSARTLITRLLTGNMGSMWLTMLFGAGGASGLGARIGARLVAAMKVARFIVIAAIPLLIVGIADDIYTAMIGGESLIGAAAESDNPFAKWISRSILGAFEVGKTLFVAGFALVDLIFGNQDPKLFIDVLKMNMLELRDWMGINFGELGIGESLRESIQDVFDWFNSVLGLMGSNLTLFGKSLKQMLMFDFDGAAASRAAMKDIGSLDEIKSRPLQMPVSTTSFSASNPSFMLPKQQGATQQTINLTINAEGTPDAIKSVATQAFADMMSSSILGVSVNYQGGK